MSKERVHSSPQGEIKLDELRNLNQAFLSQLQQYELNQGKNYFVTEPHVAPEETELSVSIMQVQIEHGRLLVSSTSFWSEGKPAKELFDDALGVFGYQSDPILISVQGSVGSFEAINTDYVNSATGDQEYHDVKQSIKDIDMGMYKPYKI